MNYVSVVMVGTGVFIALLWWLPGGKRGVFTGPNVGERDLRVLSAVNRGELGVLAAESTGGKGGDRDGGNHEDKLA